MVLVQIFELEARTLDLQWSMEEDFRSGTVIKSIQTEAKIQTSWALRDRMIYVRAAEAGTESWGPPSKTWTTTPICSDEQYLDDSGPMLEWKCKACPHGAYCVGNVAWDGVRARFGFWRVPGPSPERFRECLLPAACLGAPNPELRNRYFQGERSAASDLAGKSWWDGNGRPEGCHIAWGFKENCTNDGKRCRLCSSCDTGFKRKGLADCTQCPDSGANKVLLVSGILAVVLGGAGIVYMSIRNEGGVVEVSEAIKKIALNYLQVVSLAAVFPMKWPDAVQSFFEAQAAISSASESLLSPACELSNLPAASAFYQIQVGFAFLPLVILLFCYMVWMSIYRCKFSEPCKNRYILSCVVLLYLAYPTLVKQSLASLSCVRVGDKLWLTADLQEQCYINFHLVMTLCVSAPQFFLYSVGLPLGAFVILYSRRDRLHTKRVQFRWGILYAGFRKEVYWWELSVVVRKCSMIIIGGVFGSHLRPDMQVYLALFVVALLIVAHLAAMPFEHATRRHAVLNWLELGSLGACWATLYSGMLFFIGDTGRISATNLMLLSVAVIASNLAFSAFLAYSYVMSVLREKRKGGAATTKRRLTKMKQVKVMARLNQNSLREEAAKSFSRSTTTHATERPQKRHQECRKNSFANVWQQSPPRL